jgi:UDP-N-acetylmuramoylalanine--D-glutamate ligase
MEFKGLNITVLGLARSGVAAANYLHDAGAIVTVSDVKSSDKLQPYIDQLSSPEIKLSLEADQVNDVKKADLVVLSPGIPANIPACMKCIELGIPLISEVELAYRICRAPIIAITGSNGKTTTTTWTGEILKKVWKGSVQVAGNIGFPLTEAARNLDEKGILVAELSSFQLETITSFKPRVAAILNISQNHLDRYPGMDEYSNAKMRIFDYQTESDFAVLNLDNEELMHRLPDKIAARKVFFSKTKEILTGAFVQKDYIILRKDGRDYPVCRVDELSLPGLHNLENALAAVAMTGCFDINPLAMADPLHSFSGVEHRIEYIRELNGVKYYNDSKATTVVSVQTAVSALSSPIVLIMGGKDKGSDYKPLRPLLTEKVKHLILIGQARSIIQRDLEGSCPMTLCDTFEAAVSLSQKLSCPGDSVLLSPACSSYDMFRDYEERGRVFKKLVGELV